jgi:glyoxylase-like metal-dependent hydrolase (beta-lactamase superfamily II)
VSDRPGAPAVLPPGVVFLQRGWLNANVVVLLGPPVILIDTGYSADTDALETALWAQAGVRFEDVGLVLITHAHPDHIGAAALIRSRSGAEIATDEETADIVERWDTRLLWASYAGLRVERFRVTRVLRDGELIDAGRLSLRTIYAPGHSRGGACFWLEESGLLVSSDTVRAGSFGALNPRVDGADCLDLYLATLQRLERLGPRALLPAHGPIVTDVAANFRTVERRAADVRAHPAKLALHVMRVLLLVHLLDRTSMTDAELRDHILAATWFRDYHEDAWSRPPREAAELLVADLLSTGALERRGARLYPTMAR